MTNYKNMIRIPHLHRLTPRASLTLATGLFAGSAVMLWMHASAVRDMRQMGLPAALALPQIEERIAMLKEQNELAQLQASMRSGSESEKLRVYVIPAKDDLDRLLATIDALSSSLQRRRMLRSLSAVEVGEAIAGDQGLKALPVTFNAQLTAEGLEELLSFIEISGLLTVSDAMDPADIDRLLLLTERENPASISALELFLSTDLLTYAQEPTPYDEQLRKAFVSDYALQTIQSVIQSGRLSRARTVLSALASDVSARALWPTRLLSVESVSIEVLPGGMVNAVLTLQAYVRTDDK